MFEDIFEFIRAQFGHADCIPLHEPRFAGNEKTYLNDCIDSTYVSSVGEYVNRFELAVAELTGSRHAIAVVNGTQGLFVALKVIGIDTGCDVLTQSLTFVATSNAIHYSGASPVFIDVDSKTLGLSPDALKNFLQKHTEIRNGRRVNKVSGRSIAACLPMHTCGHPCRIREIAEICADNHIELIEDAAESLGSFYANKHTGRFGRIGVLSFNGNKVITTGGGGMLITDNEELADKLRHLTTTAKVPHQWEFIHDQIGYNFRMPNLNAALGLAQVEQLGSFLESKRQLAKRYREFFRNSKFTFINEPSGCTSNFWLNTILLPDEKQKIDFLEQANQHGIGVRSLWRPMHMLNMYKHCQRDAQSNAEDIYRRGVNLPSSVKG
ncbi:LegC family aminotransferase [Desulfopila inferna]|uniref:LegC family aminotransferase n=1 Tax=Desulfopila inferna TaxID=468528 RepID=UPI0019665632|nr:LegC family aminotransferase [Desulfopila inferna]MBM9603012.1 LegC family aminotransferase [Desulfopila inferna]